MKVVQHLKSVNVFVKMWTQFTFQLDLISTKSRLMTKLSYLGFRSAPGLSSLNVVKMDFRPRALENKLSSIYLTGNQCKDLGGMCVSFSPDEIWKWSYSNSCCLTVVHFIEITLRVSQKKKNLKNLIMKSLTDYVLESDSRWLPQFTYLCKQTNHQTNKQKKQL